MRSCNQVSRRLNTFARVVSIRRRDTVEGGRDRSTRGGGQRVVHEEAIDADESFVIGRRRIALREGVDETELFNARH